ncbi:MAG: indolepyruvate oxidoreductase subunit beta family protein [Steroidobacteraceae bacterium]
MSERTIKLTIAALGGQGGGVLTDWLIEVAEVSDYLVQATSVPGVAQRTGATIYYLEFFPRALAEKAGREPIMALMPVAGDVDCVVASELAEAGRAIARGLVTPERTTLISSTHRDYAIGEKSALGKGEADRGQLLELVRTQGRRTVLFDMEEMAERHKSVVSAVLLGAISGAGVLPFTRGIFEDAIRKSGLAVETNLAAFADAFARAEAGGGRDAPKSAAGFPEVPEKARTPALQPLLERVRALPRAVQPLVLEGARRTLDYQDRKYAALYLTRVERIAALDAQVPAEGYRLTEAAARGLALWMTFEDTIRVAELKTRAARFERVREEIRAQQGQLFGITEFMRPRVQEIAGSLPAALGAWVLRSPRISRWVGRWTGGKHIRTGTAGGFLLLYAVSGLKPWRRGTLRYNDENARIEAWLASLERQAAAGYGLAVEIARAQRLIKGYGETHERGWRNFCTLTRQLERLASRADGAEILSRLQEAALADEEGEALAREIAALGAAGVSREAQGVPA